MENIFRNMYSSNCVSINCMFSTFCDKTQVENVIFPFIPSRASFKI